MRRLIAGLCAVVVVLSCTSTYLAVHFAVRVDVLANQQKQGRRLALGVTCAAVSAVSDAGRETIANAMPLPSGVERLLEQHGFPPFDERKAEAQIAANEYVQRISTAVERQVGRHHDQLVKADGTLNCGRLQVVARAR